MKCLKCGREIPDNRPFCQYCGAKVLLNEVDLQESDISAKEEITKKTAKAEITEEREKGTKKSRNSLIRTIVFALFAVVIALYFISYNMPRAYAKFVDKYYLEYEMVPTENKNIYEKHTYKIFKDGEEIGVMYQKKSHFWKGLYVYPAGFYSGIILQAYSSEEEFADIVIPLWASYIDFTIDNDTKDYETAHKLIINAYEKENNDYTVSPYVIIPGNNDLFYFGPYSDGSCYIEHTFLASVLLKMFGL